MANEDKVDLWAGSSDIFTDYEGTITEATFRASEFGTQMVLVFDEIDGRDKPVVEYYRIPDSYESQDGGETVTRVDGANKAMSKSCKWMRFVAAAAGCKGAREALGDDAPTNANRWIGSRWHMEAEEGQPYNVKDRATGEMKKGVSKDWNLPTEFLGMEKGVARNGSGNGNGKIADLSVLADLNNDVLASQISDWAKTQGYAEWFGGSYKAIVAAGVDVNSVPDLITAMSGKDLYVKLGGRG